MNGEKKDMYNSDRKFILYPHGGSGNHGCEAIVRTTIDLIGKENDIILFSENPNEDYKYIENLDCKVKTPTLKKIKRISLDYFRAAISYHLLNRKDSYELLTFSPIISSFSKGSIFLSIGGDNYCYGDNDYLYFVDKYAHKYGCKTVLWGASVGKDDLTEKMIADLSNFDLIIARESLSYHNLIKLNPNTILIPDPAFTLGQSNGIIPEGLHSRPFIGINISPMIKCKEKVDNITMENYIYLVEKIISDTEYNIALIPHVVKDENDDRITIRELYKNISDKKRVFIVEDQNCKQLKNIIANCECFIGARTHSTIAAYSTCVPTLVIGYSVKAKGIAKDLFGTDQNYVLPVQELRNKDDIYQKFVWLWEQRKRIRNHLSVIMPTYIEKANELNNIINLKLNIL